MPIRLSESAHDRGSYITTFTFTDSSGDSVTPASVRWTLTDHKGVVINSRAGVTASPATAVSVLLEGDDLDYTDGHRRIISVTAEYNTLVGGVAHTNIPFRESAEFVVERIMGSTST